MSKSKLVIKHNLHELSKEDLQAYLKEVSAFIGLDPDLNGLDTIYMDNETGPGKSLVVYARRGTAEILRNLLGIEILSLTSQEIKGSIVFTAVGKNQAGRQEIAIGSKDISRVNGKQLDDAIMTASTRALRRLTMQFTTLGILDESEVIAVVGQTPNAAGSAQLSDNPLPPAYLPSPAVLPNNAPGKPVEPKIEASVAPALPVPSGGPAVVAFKEEKAAKVSAVADIEGDKLITIPTASPLESAISTVSTTDTEVAKTPKRARKKANTVALDVEPEVVQKQPPPAAPVQADVAVPAQAHSVVQNPLNQEVSSQVAAPTPPPPPPVTEGLPTKEQMDEYRKRVSVYTTQLPPSENLGSTQKMRAFITKMSGSAPQDMSASQWDEMISFFEAFVEKNQIKGLIKYVNDLLGVK
jgi:hypothetical protein